MTTNLFTLLDYVYAQPSVITDMQTFVNENPYKKLFYIYKSMFQWNEYYHFAHATYCISTQVIMDQVIKPTVSLPVYQELYNIVFVTPRVLLLPFSILDYRDHIELAIEQLNHLNYAQKLYYEALLTTLSNNATVLQLTAILQSVFLQGHDIIPQVIPSWLESISFEDALRQFKHIIDEFIPLKFAEVNMKELCIDTLKFILENLNFVDYNSVYNLFLQTLYEISAVIGDNITAASDTVSNANFYTSPNVLANELEKSFDSALNTTVSDGDQGEMPRRITDNFYYRLMEEVNRTDNGLDHMVEVLTYN